MLTQVGFLKDLSINVEAGVAGGGLGPLAGAFRPPPPCWPLS